MNPNTPPPADESQPPAPGPTLETPPPVVSPEVPVEPQEAVITPTPTPTPTPKNSKKLLLIIAGIVGAVVLAAVGVAAYIAYTTVSKDDYAAAATQFSTVNKASVALTTDVYQLNVSTASETAAFDEDAQAVEDSIAKIKTETDALSKLKAVRVGEGKERYDAFKAKSTAYLENASNLLASVKTLRPAVLTCNEISTVSNATERLAAIKACSVAINDVDDLPSPEFQTFVTTLKEQYKAYAIAYEQGTALTDPLGAQYEQYVTLRDKLTSIQATLSDANETFVDALEKRDEELSVKATADRLAGYLNEQK